MENENFINRIVQIFSSFFTIGGIVSQYLLREEFKSLLRINEDSGYYDAFTLAGMVFGVILILGLFPNRYFLLNKVYPRKGQLKKYYKYQNETRSKLQGSQNESHVELQQSEEIVLEPYYIDGKRFAFIALFVSVFSFALIFIFSSPLLKSIFYLVFILTSITSSTIFTLLIYNENDWKTKERLNRNKIIDILKEYFSPKINIVERNEDMTNYFNPRTQMIVGVRGKKYYVNFDKNNPEKDYHINAFKGKKTKSKK